MAKREVMIAGAVIAAVVMVSAGVLFYILNDDDALVKDNDTQTPSEWDDVLLDEKNATDDGVDEIVSANNQFALDLYLQLLESEDENVLI